MPGRSYSATSQYRYGFNGKELDKETISTTTYDYGFRIYSPGLGRFLSVDPLTKEYPMLTPYAFAENQPIWAIDLDGLEKYIVINYLNNSGAIYKTEIRGIRSTNGKNAVDMQMKNAHGKSLTSKDVYVVNKLSNGKLKDVGGKKNLTPEEQKLYNSSKVVAPENTEEGNGDLPYNNNITDAILTENGEYISKEFDGDKFEFFGKTAKVPAAPLKFQGHNISPNQKYNFEMITVYGDKTSPPPEGTRAANQLGAALQNSGISSIIIQPKFYDPTGGEGANTVQSNGKTFIENINIQYQAYGDIIRRATGGKIKVTIQYPKGSTTPLGSKGLEITTK